jgi:hypothetical protein
MAGKRRFGRVRRLPSGRWQARYKGPDGIDWHNPDAGRVKLADYAPAWVAERPNLRPTTLQLSGRTYPQSARIVRALRAVADRCRQPVFAAVTVTVAVIRAAGCA